MPGSRFSLLLLEPGEIYFEDFSVTCIQESNNTYQRGRLRLCSKSIMFEPTDCKYPIIKVNLSYCSSISEEGDFMVINCTQIVEMLANNVVAPYVFLKNSFTLKFTFHYASSKECLHRLSQLHRASTLPPKDQQEMMEAIVHSRHSRVHFDPCWLEDLHESIQFEAKVIQVSPLVSNPGRVVLTSSRLYYQPYNREPVDVMKIRLASDMERVVRRRYLLQNSAMEIYCKEHCTTKYLFLAFDKTALCDELFKKLEPKNKPNTGLDVATLQWQHGILSNYDYLLFLNSAADRSFNDLTQYPVFPWVVKDFTSATLDLEDPSIYRDLSLPVGALNPNRLKQLLERFADMPEPKFLYGSHYMAPGFVLFYLARKFPQLVLCLHGGRFDHPDRMFNSLQQTWQNVLNGAADYKELVPEFYGGEGDFLVNYLGINFGNRSSDGRPVHDVELPPWAKTPQDLIAKLRQALESEHVSRKLHLWIDLIFGHLQRGPKAIEARNLFHPLCYEGSVDLCAVIDPVTRLMYEIQILEFGQIPRQLFTKPHPARYAGLIPTPLSLMTSSDVQTGSQEEEDGAESRTRSWSQGRLCDLQIHTVFQGHKKSVTGLAFYSQSGDVQAVSVSLDGFLKAYKLREGKQVLSVCPIESSPLTACLNLPGSNAFVLGTLQNEVALYQIDCCRLDNVTHVHDDNITALGIGNDENEGDLVLASASSDCSVKLWRVRRANSASHFRFRPPTDLIVELEHDSSVISLDFHPAGLKLATGTKEGQLYLWEVPSGLQLDTLSGHTDEVSAIKFSPDGSKLVSVGHDGILQVFQVDIDPPQMVARSEEMAAPDKNEDFRCLAWDGLSILLGTALGDMLIFDLVTFKVVRRVQAHGPGALTCIAVAPSVDDLVVVTAGQDGRVCLWRPRPIVA
ncbi:protein FAN-like [Daphnia pulicaria]|uniref:protein FAN-like n=1 Tax=Daphnia pulicaria TaxID=35523 RepID=UPI001EEB3B84|nr:protein FAN-like [Daphnia pulicaria]